MIGSDTIILTTSPILLIILHINALVASCVVLDSVVVNRIIPDIIAFLHGRAYNLVELATFLLL